MTPSSLPDLPWQKIGTDIFEWNKRKYILIVDYHSRYIEITLLSGESAEEVVNKTKSIFARHGIPETVMSDNGPQFTSAAYESFSKKYEFDHNTSSPYFPQCNGEAERAVRTIKSLLLKKCEDPCLALLSYRTTPIQGGKYSPSELLMNRLLRSTTPSTREHRKPRIPDPEIVREQNKREKETQKRNYDSHHGARELPPLITGEMVWLPDRKKEARVHSQVAPRSYEVTTPEGAAYKRNRKDILPIPETNTETEQESSQQTSHPANQPPSLCRSARSSQLPGRYKQFIKQ